MAIWTNCAGYTRRDCLRLGLTALFGGGLAPALRVRAAATAALPIQAKGCILIWLDGGPTHYETFDPKPEAPAEIRGKFDTIETGVPGVRFSEGIPNLAQTFAK